MAYPNSFDYDPFYRPDTPFHPPSSLPSFHDYIQPTIPSYHPIWCHHCQNSFHYSEQCPSIGYSLGLGQNQFNSTFQGPMSESYPSNFNSEYWNYSDSACDQPYTNSQSNWSCTEPSPPSWEFDNEHEKLMSTLEKSFESMQQTMIENNQQLIEACAHMDKIMSHLNQHDSIPSLEQDQEFHQLSQTEFNGNQVDKDPALEGAFETFRQTSKQVLNGIKDCLNSPISELASKQEKGPLSTQLVSEPIPTRPMSIQDHINLHKMNKVQTVSPEEQIIDHIDISTHSIEMPFESTPSLHLNRIEEFEHEKPVEEVVNVHEVYKIDNDSQCLDEVIRNYMATHTPRVEPVESYCEDGCDDDELLLRDEQFEDEFLNFCENTSAEKQKISSNRIEKMEHIDHDWEDAYKDDEPLFLDEFFKDECDHNGEKTCVEDLKFRVPFERRKLDLSIFTFDEPINVKSFEEKIQEPSLIDQNFENLFEDELMCLDESIRDALVSYSPLKKLVDPSFEEMFEDELKFLGNHIVATPIMLCDNDESMRRRCGKKSKRKWRKVMNKLERMRVKMTKRLTSPICPLKRTHWNDGKRARGNRPRKI